MAAAAVVPLLCAIHKRKVLSKIDILLLLQAPELHAQLHAQMRAQQEEEVGCNIFQHIMSSTNTMHS